MQASATIIDNEVYLPGGHIVQVVLSTLKDPALQAVGDPLQSYPGQEAQATFGLFTRSEIASARRSLAWPLLVLKRLWSFISNESVLFFEINYYNSKGRPTEHFN